MATALATPFVSPVEAEVFGELVGFAVQEFSSSQSQIPTVACIMPTLDPLVSAGFLAYHLTPERRADGVWDNTNAVPKAAPHYFADRYLAQLFAQHVWGATVIETHDGRGDRDRVAWDQWSTLTARAGPLPLTEPLGANYFLATAPDPGQGVILWRPMLTHQGVAIGVLSNHSPMSLTEAPYVFRDVDRAKRMLAEDRRMHATVIPLDHLPDALSVQLVASPLSVESQTVTGPAVYVRKVGTTTRFRTSSPEPAGKLRLVPGDLIADRHPAWYVSPHPQGVFAWRPVDDRNLECLMSASRQGAWRVQRWPDVAAALRDLGHAGVWAQRSPEFDPSPPSLGAHRVLRSPGGPSL